MKTLLRSLVLAAVAVGSSSLVACVAQGPDGNPVGSDQSATKDVAVGAQIDNITHVSLKADLSEVQVELGSLEGHPTTVVGKLPEGLLPATYSVKPGGACLPSEITVSDAVAGVSSPMPGHESLCVSGEGKLELARICHTFRIVDEQLVCVSTWAQKAKSFTVGPNANFGHFHAAQACVDYRPGDKSLSDILPSSYLTLGTVCAIEPKNTKDLGLVVDEKATAKNTELLPGTGVAGK